MGVFLEKFHKIRNSFRMSSEVRHMEDLRVLKGELFVKAYDHAQNGRKVYDYHKSNIIVNTASILIARLLKDNKEFKLNQKINKSSLTNLANCYKKK